MAETKELTWQCDGKTISLGADYDGRGPRVLLLPALSSISTRREMAPLQALLAAHYETIAVDWPGFGDRARPPQDWQPRHYSDFLNTLIGEALPPLHAVIAAGHGASYALACAAAAPPSISRLVLLSPTWRGPLPTMMNGPRPWFDRVCRAVDHPLFGPLLYKLNVSRPVIRFMAAGHVYVERAFIEGERLTEKLAVTRVQNARFASVRFVAGKLDAVASRGEFLDLARGAGVPILMIYGADTPPRSRAEMEALAEIAAVQSVRLPRGKLSVYEEFPHEVAAAIEPFLSSLTRP